MTSTVGNDSLKAGNRKLVTEDQRCDVSEVWVVLLILKLREDGVKYLSIAGSAGLVNVHCGEGEGLGPVKRDLIVGTR